MTLTTGSTAGNAAALRRSLSYAQMRQRAETLRDDREENSPPTPGTAGPKHPPLPKSQWRWFAALSVLGLMSYLVLWRVQERRRNGPDSPEGDEPDPILIYKNGGGGEPNPIPIYAKNGTILDVPLVLWSSDFHISPIADIKHLLRHSMVRIIDKSLSGHCHVTDTCQTDLRVLTAQNGIELTPCPNKLRREFYDSYRRDKQFLEVDAFLCTHAASMCEVFMPFGKPLIVIASTRYEIGRLDADSWRQWNANLQSIAASPYNTIAANNRYDQAYIKYFTGIDAILLPNTCAYVGDVGEEYAPTRADVLIGPGRGLNEALTQELYGTLGAYNDNQRQKAKNGSSWIYTGSAEGSLRGGGVGAGGGRYGARAREARGAGGGRGGVPQIITMSTIRSLYPHFQYSDLAAHPAVLLLPYQVSLMSIFELYRMAVPLLVPSPRLLAQWHTQYGVLKERTWMGTFGSPQPSLLPRHANSSFPTPGHEKSSFPTPESDPNDDSASSLLEWVQLADMYQWPHLLQFRSFAEALDILADRALLEAASLSMRVHSRAQEGETRRQWGGVLSRVQAHRERGGMGGGGALPADVNAALAREYGYTLSEQDCMGQLPVKGRGQR